MCSAILHNAVNSLFQKLTKLKISKRSLLVSNDVSYSESVGLNYIWFETTEITPLSSFLVIWYYVIVVLL